jgi:hypothetical protein
MVSTEVTKRSQGKGITRSVMTTMKTDFISRDQLIAAMQAWVFDKHRALEQVLSEQEVLSPDHQKPIE